MEAVFGKSSPLNAFSPAEVSNGFWAPATVLPPAPVEKISLELSSVLLQVKDPAPVRPCQFCTRNSLCNPLYLDQAEFSRIRSFRKLQSARPVDWPGAPGVAQGVIPAGMKELKPLAISPASAGFALIVWKLPTRGCPHSELPRPSCSSAHAARQASIPVCMA